MTTEELLQAYSRERSEEAFRLLVNAHIDLVYSAALRQMRDPALAEDIAQLVFITLAQKAHTLHTRVPLDAWLLGVTRIIAANTRRQRARYLRHEQGAAAMIHSSDSAPQASDWEAISPHLDSALAQLRPVDRNLIVLRFMRNLPLREAGFAVGMSENSAGKRLARTLEKLRIILTRKGVTLPTTVISAALISHGMGEAPQALAAAISHSAVLAAKSGAALGLGGSLAMATAKTKIVAAFLAVILLAVFAIPFVTRKLATTPFALPSAALPSVAATDAALEITADEATGRVLDGKGDPVKDATVSFPHFTPLPRYAPTYRNDRIPSVTTDSNGIFRFPAFGSAGYNYMQVDKEGYAPRWITDLPIGKALEIRLDNFTHLTGTILMPDKTAADQASIVVITSRPTQRPQVQTVSDLQISATTDAHGHFDLPLEPGAYDLQVIGPEGLFARLQNVQLTAGQTFDQTITLAAGVRVKVRAIDTLTGNPVPNIALSLWKRFPGAILTAPGTARKTNSQGVAEWASVMPGAQRLDVSAKAYAQWSSPDVSDANQVGISAFHLDLKPPTEEILIRMEPAMHLSGTVVDTEGNAVPGMFVNIDGLQTGDSRYAQRTNARGKFDLYVPATSSAANTPCKLVLLRDLAGAAPRPLATSEAFTLTVGGAKSFTIILGDSPASQPSP